ncbi:MAG TPA: serine/threonine-protein kinase, partial [Herpetosiphonaceae bacterium]
MSTVIGGRYSLEQVLGQGGMATVYEARDATLNRTVALKMLRPELYGDAAAQARFLREARIAASFSHPHIARVYDVGEDAVYGPFFIQELVPGQSLDELLPVHATQALGWVREIAGALAAAHARGIVHCDVKPQNVRVTPEGKALLIDFGVAEEAGAGSGKVLGTPHYLAPERAMGDPPTPAADIYALGVLLYELLTGRVPLDGATPTEVIQRHISEGVPGLRGAIPGQAAAIESMIAKATRRDPAQRYPSVDDFLTDAEAIERQAAVSTVAMAPQRPRATVSIHNMPTQAMAQAPRAAAPIPGEAPAPASGPRPAPAAR